MASNIFQQRITPVKPKILEGQQIFVYVEEASTYADGDTDKLVKKGIAAYLNNHFNVVNGRVKLNVDYLSKAPFERFSLIQLDKLDFTTAKAGDPDNRITKVNWPIAYRNAGIYDMISKGTNTEGFGLMSIAENSSGWLKYDRYGNTEVDTSKVTAAIKTITDPLDSRLTKAESDIAVNTENIKTLDTEFTSIKGKFEDLTILVNTFDSRITTNTEDIITNTENITTNTNNIIKLNNEVSNIKLVNIEQNTQIYDLQTRTKGLGGYLNTYNFGVEVTQDALTNYAMEQISVTDKTQIFNGTKVINSYDKHLWVLTNTPNSNPIVFEWEDLGVSQEISVATVDLLGLVKSSGKNLEGNVNTNTGIITINGLTELQDQVVNHSTQIASIEDQARKVTSRVDSLEGELPNKQDKLTAGGNITIKDNTISSDLSNYYTKEEVNNLLPIEEDWTMEG